MASRLDKLRESLLLLREDRAKIKTLKEDTEKRQPELVTLVQTVDSDGAGIVVDPNDKRTGTAFIQHNAAGEFWDIENVIQFLKDEKMWMACSSRSFDQQKFEAEIANGNIPLRKVKKFKKQGNRPAPFIRFGVQKDESL